MGVTLLLQAEPDRVTEGGIWSRGDGKAFAEVVYFHKCRQLLEDHTGISLAPCFNYAEDVPTAEFLRKEYVLDETEIAEEREQKTRENERAWHSPDQVVACLDALIGSLPLVPAHEWSDDDDDKCGTLYAQLGSELRKDRYFYEGEFVQNLIDLRAAVERAKAGGAKRVRLFMI